MKRGFISAFGTQVSQLQRLQLRSCYPCISSVLLTLVGLSFRYRNLKSYKYGLKNLLRRARNSMLQVSSCHAHAVHLIFALHSGAKVGTG